MGEDTEQAPSAAVYEQQDLPRRASVAGETHRGRCGHKRKHLPALNIP